MEELKKIYIVCGGWDREGFENIAVFENTISASICLIEAKSEGRYDYVEIEEHEVRK